MIVSSNDRKITLDLRSFLIISIHHQCFKPKENLEEEKSKRQQRILTLMYSRRKVFLHCNIRH